MTAPRLTAVATCALLVAAACHERAASPRAEYNRGVDYLATGELELAEKALLTARDEAGYDPTLRFNAAYDLGLAYARQADAASADKPEEAIDLLRQSAGWFRDAVRLRPDDDDARVNLELTLRRIQVLVDQLNKGANGLEPRLARIIEDQRSLRDQVRGLMAAVDAAGAGAEPVAFQGEFDGLATFERTLLAEAGTLSDLAGDERDLLDNRPEDQRTDEDRMRLVQLQNLDHYLQRARTSLADARRYLRRLQGDAAHRRADTALAELNRAREQLMDPVAVLKGITEDQVVLHQHTRGLDALEQGAISVDGEAPAKAPPWLTREHLGDRQRIARERTDELRLRLEAGVGAADQAPAPDDANAAPPDPRQQQMIEAARAAVPFVATANDAMQAAATALDRGALAEAGAQQARALDALVQAIERFADIRTLIELAHRDQTGAVALMTPPQPGVELPEMSAEERRAQVDQALARNAERLTRLQALFDTEVATLEAQAGAAAQQGQQPPSEEELAAAKQRFELAETHRKAALDAIEATVARLAAGWRGPTAEGPNVPAQQALDQITELRRLFYSLIEHLQELLRNQTATHDETASAQAAADDQKAALLGPLADRQRRHEQMGAALAEALAEQADAAAQAQAQGQGQQPDAADMADKYSAAAAEVRSANTEMAAAAQLLEEGREQAATTSYDVEPILTRQQAAMEHLQKALELLQPPKQDQQQQDQQDQEQQQQDQQQQDQQQQQQQQEMSQQQADRRLQRIRDREAERERERRKRQRMAPDPVEKDW